MAPPRPVAPIPSALAFPGGHSPDRVLESEDGCTVFVGDRVVHLAWPQDPGVARAACLEALRLHRRLTPDLYLGVAPANVAVDGTLQVGDPVAPEALPERAGAFALVARRVSAGVGLAAALEGDSGGVAAADALAELLVSFHRSADAARASDPEALERSTLAALTGTPLRAACGALAEGLERRARDLFAAEAERFRRRSRDAVDGHGDLRARRVRFEGGRPLVLGGAPLDPSRRRGDVAVDLATLCADLERDGHHAGSRSLIERYVARSQDAELSAHLVPHKLARAVDRAARSARAGAVEESRAWLNLAASYVLPPTLILTCGLPATGKSWIGDRLSQSLGIPVYKSDVRRKEIAGEAIRRDRRDAYDQGLYTPENKQLTYDSLLDDARRCLGAGHSVVIDGSFVQAKWRGPFAALAAELGQPLILLEMRADEATVKRRIEQRLLDPDEPSEADFNVYLALRKQWEAPDELAAGQHLPMESGGSLAATIGAVARRALELADRH